MESREILRGDAIRLRKLGKTYSEIGDLLKTKIPKSTLNNWFKNILINDRAKSRLDGLRKTSLSRAREKSLKNRAVLRNIYLNKLRSENKHLIKLFDNKDIAKIAVILLYLGEGTKNSKRAILTFANSDPRIISLFLKLFRKQFNVDERKFRCTVQGREDQDFKSLEKFWSSLTDIPKSQFYKGRIDPRTVGVNSKNKDYKGVCRLDYLSAHVLNDILQGIDVLTGL
jgi:hypothetical protein